RRCARTPASASIAAGPEPHLYRATPERSDLTLPEGLLWPRRSLLVAVLVRLRLRLTVTEGRAENIAEAGTAVGGAVLRHRLLFLVGLVRLDREADATAVAVDRGDLRVHPFADREPLRTLLAAVARQLGATDEARDVAGQRQLDAVLVHRRDGAGHHLTPANALERGLERIVLELLDAEADTLLLHVHVQHLHPDSVAAVVVLDRLRARPLPVEVGEVDHAVDVARQADEQAELGDVLDLALELRADRVALHEALPRVAHGLLDAEADATLVRIDVEHLDFDLLTGR